MRPAPVLRRVLLPLLLSALGVAGAHSYLERSVPAEDAVVSAPREVRLAFNEAVEVKYSTVKVYPVGASGDPLKVNGAAGALKTRVLTLKNDAKDRADLGIATKDRTATELVLPLKAKLKPGAYVVMWKVLSVDTHTLDGYYVFTVK